MIQLTVNGKAYEVDAPADMPVVVSSPSIVTIFSLHSFTYGTRPPLSHKDFVARVKEWINKGAALPDK